MHGFHKGDIGVYRFFMRSAGIFHQHRRTHAALNGVQQRQTRKYADSKLLLLLRQRVPRLNIIRERHFFRQPEVTGQTVPYLKVFIVLKAVPVNRIHSRQTLHHRHQSSLTNIFLKAYPRLQRTGDATLYLGAFKRTLA